MASAAIPRPIVITGAAAALLDEVDAAVPAVCDGVLVSAEVPPGFVATTVMVPAIDDAVA